MITNFDDYTSELDKYEFNVLLPQIVGNLKKHVGKERAVTSAKICNFMKKRDYNITPERLRKIINVIRRSGEIPLLIATSKGYYVATEKKEVLDFIESLQQRASAINAVREAIEKQLNQKQ